MEAFDAAAGCGADSCDARSVAGAVLAVDLLDDRFADCFSGLPDSAGRLHARDAGDQARARDPEARRHLAPPLVLDNARQAERATGRDAERVRSSPEASVIRLQVSRIYRRDFRHEAMVNPGR